MPDLWGQVLGIEGLPWIIGITFVAGIVRGFSGFGTAMVYLPVAGQFLPPVWAIVTLALMDLFGPLPNVRKAWAVAHRRDLMRLTGASVLTLPIGLALLVAIDPTIFRYAISGLALIVLVILISGFRYRGEVSRPMIYGVGATSGILGGIAGMPGPPIILFYMASPHGPEVVRANMMLFLLGYSVLVVGLLGGQGHATGVPLVLGLLLAIPNLLGNVVGGRIFNPAHETVYRFVAYAIIAISAISGLPFWS